jgi:hypothetical protein
MKKKYGALRTIGTIYKIIGVVIAIFTVIGALGICIVGFAGGSMMQGATSLLGEQSGSMNPAGAGIAGVLMAIWVLITGAISSVSIYALGEGVYLLLDLEENTRKTSDLLESRA